MGASEGRSLWGAKGASASQNSAIDASRPRPPLDIAHTQHNTARSDTHILAPSAPRTPKAHRKRRRRTPSARAQHPPKQAGATQHLNARAPLQNLLPTTHPDLEQSTRALPPTARARRRSRRRRASKGESQVPRAAPLRRRRRSRARAARACAILSSTPAGRSGAPPTHAQPWTSSSSSSSSCRWCGAKFCPPTTRACRPSPRPRPRPERSGCVEFGFVLFFGGRGQAVEGPFQRPVRRDRSLPMLPACN